MDGGSAGANSFPGFKRYVISRAQTRVLASLNISNIGLIVTNELYLDPAMLDVKAAVATIKANPPTLVGLKVRIHGEEDRAAHLLRELVLAGVEVIALSKVRSDLEDVYQSMGRDEVS